MAGRESRHPPQVDDATRHRRALQDRADPGSTSPESRLRRYRADPSASYVSIQGDEPHSREMADTRFDIARDLALTALGSKFPGLRRKAGLNPAPSSEVSLSANLRRSLDPDIDDAARTWNRGLRAVMDTPSYRRARKLSDLQRMLKGADMTKQVYKPPHIRGAFEWPRRSSSGTKLMDEMSWLLPLTYSIARDDVASTLVPSLPDPAEAWPRMKARDE